MKLHSVVRHLGRLLFSSTLAVLVFGGCFFVFSNPASAVGVTCSPGVSINFNPTFSAFTIPNDKEVTVEVLISSSFAAQRGLACSGAREEPNIIYCNKKSLCQRLSLDFCNNQSGYNCGGTSCTKQPDGSIKLLRVLSPTTFGSLSVDDYFMQVGIWGKVLSEEIPVKVCDGDFSVYSPQKAAQCSALSIISTPNIINAKTTKTFEIQVSGAKEVLSSSLCVGGGKIVIEKQGGETKYLDQVTGDNSQKMSVNVDSVFNASDLGKTHKLSLFCYKLAGALAGPGERICDAKTITLTDLEGNVHSEQATFDLCKQAASGEEQVKCQDCINKKTIPGKEGLWTAVGCIPTDTQGIVESLLRIGLGLSGGFVILTILAAAFLFATSSGDPKKVQEAQEMVSSAIIGLLFVIFSVIILTFIGVSVLRIPGFGTS